MHAPAAKFGRQDIGSANVQFLSGIGMPDPLDVAVDPYAPTKRTQGIRIKGFQAWPQKGGPFPAVIILHERWGLTQHYQHLAFRLAEHGYVALAVDQYSRTGSVVTSDAAHAAQLMAKVTVPSLMQDLMAAAEYLNYQDYIKKHRIAVIGFDMGGSFALNFAACRRQLRACIAFYGKVPLDALGSLHCPVLFHQAEHDDVVSAQEVDALSEKLAAQHVACDIQKYPGTQHGFFNSSRPDVYQAEAADQAWLKSLAFLDDYILADHAGVRPLPDSQKTFK
jgi:carboxymethylenebutenolidase